MIRYTNLFFAFLFILGGISFLIYFGAEEMFFNSYLELLVFCGPLFLGVSIRKSSLTLLVFCLAYLLGSYVYSVVLRGDHLMDFLLSFKVFIYLIFILTIPAEGVISEARSKKFATAFFILFLIKYTVGAFLLSINRPQLLAENNFELMFLGIIYYVNFTREKKPNYTYLFLLVLIFVLSGSRSGIVILMLILAFSTYSENRWLSTTVKVFAISVIGVVGVALFLNRLGSLDFESIDRVVFFQYFLNDTSTWGLKEFLIGAERITSLSPTTCEGLKFYSGLFSYANDGSCYSVILHSFVLRAIFDHGFLGLFFIIYTVYFFLKYKGLSGRDSAVICAMVTLNGLSVSSFNSVFFILSMMSIAIVKFEKPQFKSSDLPLADD